MINPWQTSGYQGFITIHYPIFKQTRIESPQNLSRGTWHCWKHLHCRVPAIGLCLQRSCDFSPIAKNHPQWLIMGSTYLNWWFLIIIFGFEWFYHVLPCFTISFYTHVLWFFMVLPWAHPKAAQRRSTEPGSWRSRRRGGDFPYDETGAAKQFAIWSPMGLGGTGKMYKNVGSTHIIIFNKFHNTNSIYFHNQAWELQNVHRKVRSLPQAATTALMWKTLTSACAAQSATMNFKTRFLMWSTAFWYSNV